MPAGKSQSNAALYTAITFLSLFIISTVCAVIYYVKYEEQKQIAVEADAKVLKIVKSGEKVDDIVGKVGEDETKGKYSYIGQMNAHLDTMLEAITGQAPDEKKSASAKVQEVSRQINEVMEDLGDRADSTYGVALLQNIKQLKSSADGADRQLSILESQLADAKMKYKKAQSEFSVTESRLVTESKRWQEKAANIQNDYAKLKMQMEDSTAEQIALYQTKLDQRNTRLNEERTAKDDATKQLKKTATSLDIALGKLEEIKPNPNVELAAYKEDARVIDVDMQQRIAYINIGSKDHVYKGLTFSIYDRSGQIPEDGKGKAEIEVISVSEGISVARIISWTSNPVVKDDVAANLIWDSESSNEFVIAGEFDFDGDGQINADGKQKIIQLIESWGGKVADKVSVNTDFVVLGLQPLPLRKPSRDDAQIDPMLETRYQKSVDKVISYGEVMTDAKELQTPVFNQKRFFHLIGHVGLANKSKPF